MGKNNKICMRLFTLISGNNFFFCPCNNDSMDWVGKRVKICIFFPNKTIIFFFFFLNLDEDKINLLRYFEAKGVLGTSPPFSRRCFDIFFRYREQTLSWRKALRGQRLRQSGPGAWGGYKVVCGGHSSRLWHIWTRAPRTEAAAGH